MQPATHNGHPHAPAQKVEPGARMQAILQLFFDDLDDIDDAELERRKKLAPHLASMSDEEIEQALHGEGQAEPQQREGDLLRHMRGGEDPTSRPFQYAAGDPLRVPGEHKIGGQQGGQFVGAQTLARWYASLWNNLEAAGFPPPDHEIETAESELHPHGWTLDRDDETGLWFAEEIHHVERAKGPIRHARGGDGEGPLQYAAKRAPRGGITIAGKAFKGGQFIPSEYANSAEGQAKLGAQEEKGKALPAKGGAKARIQHKVHTGEKVDRDALMRNLDSLIGDTEINSFGRDRANRIWKLWQHHHGAEGALHRLQEVAQLTEHALLHGKEEARPGLRWKLAELRHMMGLETAQKTGPERPRAGSGSTMAAGGTGHELETTGGTGADGGLPAGRDVGKKPGAAPAPTVPGTGGGTGGNGRPDSVPGGAGGQRETADGAPGGPGDAAGGGAGTGAGGPLPGAAGGAGSAGVLAGGGGAGERGAGGDAVPDEQPASVSPAEESLAEPPTPENPTDLAAGNWRYQDRDFFKGGLKAKYRQNIDAIRTLRTIKAEGRDMATPEEQAVLSKYVGWGQFPQLFGYNYSPEWQKEREELRSLLGEEEYDAARKSTLNAHYTHPGVVDAHWKMASRLGFKGGRFLETSAGIGYYLGLMPEDLAGKTRSSAVELDNLTGEMLKLLYPKADVQVQGFEKFQQADNFYDLVASNVPFGDYGVHDPRYNKHQAHIHDYFFLKSLDKVRHGGLVMHITSAGTLDKQDPAIRQELMKHCDLVGAIRFPGGAHKENAGTEVVTDLLILRKRHPGEQPVDANETPLEAAPKEPGFTGITTDSLGRLYHWVDGKRVPGPKWDDTVTVPDPAGGEPIPVNRYFAEHPEQVLGTLDRSGSMYHGESVNVSRPEDYEKRLEDAIGRLPEGLLKQTRAPRERFDPSTAPAPGDTKEGGYQVQGGKVYARKGGEMVAQEVDAATAARIQGHLGVRDAVRAVINDQLQGRDATGSRARLNEVYDAFVKKHGFLNLPANKRAFREDPDSFVLLALEHFDAKTKKATKADIFHKDVIGHVPSVEKAGTVAEALGVSLHETGGVDVERMAELVGADAAVVGRKLVASGIAFEDPQEGWKPADQYLSGNVRRKLTLARAAAKNDPRFNANVTALEGVQPEDVDHTEIEARLGAPWIPPSDVTSFAAYLAAIGPGDFDIKYIPATGTWLADVTNYGERRLARSQQASKVWATDRADFMDCLGAALNNTTVTVWDKDADGKRYVNVQATQDANAKVQEFKEAFRGWVWEDDERRERLHRHYNDNFNNIRPMRYNGSHQTFPGMNPAIQLRDHQKDFAWQVVTTGNGLAAHEVGAGKSKAMIASAMELRRLGLARKPAIACLKANIESITNEAIELYPGARILSTADMFDAAKRKETISRIATGDYDLVLLTHEHLGMLQMKPEAVERYVKDEMKELEAAIKASQEENPKKSNRVVKELEKAKARLEATLKEALDESKKDDAVFFEELGIDQLFVDEFHAFKSLPVYTKQRQIKGIPTQRSDRATEMLMKTKWLREQNGGRGVVAATGTPVTNTMAELYNLQRYLQPELLKERGIENFDAWASTFADMETKSEFTVTGEYKPVSRFARFVNIPELTQMTGQVMDVQRVDDLKKPDGTPAVVRPRRRDSVVTAPKGEAMESLMKSLQARARAIKGQRHEKGGDHMFKICNDGRLGALDMRLLDASAEDHPDSKTNQAVRKVLDLHQSKPGTTQLIFCDMGVNPTDQGFHLYQDIIDKLAAGGIPREKIADFSKLEGAKKEAAMQAMRRGDIVIGIGSTDKMGTGVNVQHKLAALHHLDTPRSYTPAGVEQRDGRGWRQDNENKEVEIHRYVSEGSLDQLMWQIIGNKARFIKQVVSNKSDSSLRAAREEDAEELTPEQLMAAASGDPRIMEKVNLDDDVKNLRLAQARHEREQAKFRDTVKNTERNLPRMEQRAKAVKQDADAFAAHPDFAFEVGGKHFDKQGEAEAAFKEWQKANAETLTDRYGGSQRVGSYRGFPVVVEGAAFYLQGPSGEKYKTGSSVASMAYNAKIMATNAANAEAEVGSARADVERVRGQIGKAFGKAQELAEKGARAKQLEEILKTEKNPQQAAEGAPAMHARLFTSTTPQARYARVGDRFRGPGERTWLVLSSEKPPATAPWKHMICAVPYEKEAPRQGDDARGYARWLASFFSDLEAANSPPSRTQWQDACEELADSGWTLRRHGDRTWYAHELDEQPHRHRRVKQGTPGAVQRTNASGHSWWIDAEQAAREEAQGGKRKVGATHAASRERRKARGTTKEGLLERLRPHASGEALDPKAMRGAKAGARMLTKYHGELAMHRLDELVDMAERGLAKGGAKAGALKARLSQLHAMAEIMGGGEKGSAAEGVKKQEAPAEGTSRQLAASGEVPPLDDLQGIADATRTGAFHDNKVFISHAWQEAKKKYPSLTLGRFKRELLEANRQGKVHLSRADLVSAMDLKDIEESEIPYLNATFHFIVVKPDPTREQTKPERRHEVPGDSHVKTTHEKTLAEFRKENDYDRSSREGKKSIDAQWQRSVGAAVAGKMDLPPEVVKDYEAMTGVAAVAPAPKPAPAKPAPAKPAKPAFVRPADVVAGMPGAEEYLAKKQEMKTHEWPGMSREQERHQFEEVGRLKASNPQKAQAIRDMLIEANVGLANSAANAFAPKGGDVEELRQEALFKLTKLVNDDEFDPSLGYKFSTFAKDAITKHLISKATKEGKLRKKFQTGEGGDEETPGRIGQIQDTRNDVRGNQHRVSEAVAGMMKKATPAELPPRARQVIEMRHGMGEFQGDKWVPHESGDPDRELTFKAIGAHFGVTAPAAQQAYKAALKKLQPVVERQGVTSESFRKRALVLQYIKRALEA